MSATVSETLPAAEADAPRIRHVVVLTKPRRVQAPPNTFVAPAGSVLREVMLSPNKTAQQLGRPLAADEWLVADPDRAVKLGDVLDDLSG